MAWNRVGLDPNQVGLRDRLWTLSWVVVPQDLRPGKRSAVPVRQAQGRLCGTKLIISWYSPLVARRFTLVRLRLSAGLWKWA
jgi:hypothetical protein